METKTKSKFKGNFNWRVPNIIASFIEGADAEAFLEEFNGLADVDYKGNSNIKVLAYDGNVVAGSNPFAVVLANQILRPMGIRTATPADLGRILESSSLPLRRQYEDASLVVRTDKCSYDRNTPLAQDLVKQVRARGIEPSTKNHIMIPLTGFDLTNADNQYGLAFQLRNDVELFEAPVLIGKNNNKRFSKTDDRALPIFDEGGERRLYTQDEGLSWLCLDSSLYVLSYGGDLAYSDGDGRVVLIRG
ncbi:hypothetical protein HYV50_00935 [Candidatus Pacearchaeota archaeon]|nr:hypothetical protein [Candidatus Pacearchaeota archaeon]